MAGITGIISLGDKQISGLDPVMFARMKNALGGSQQQAGKEFLDKRIFVANKLPVLTKNNDRFCVNERLGVVCVLDGTIYIQKDPKREIVQEYSLQYIDRSSVVFPIYSENMRETWLCISKAATICSVMISAQAIRLLLMTGSVSFLFIVTVLGIILSSVQRLNASFLPAC